MSSDTRIIRLTANIIGAYVKNNAIRASELPRLIANVFETLSARNSPERRETEPAQGKPAISIRRSVSDDAIICLEDGLKLQTLKRHLQSAHGLTVEQYRRRWRLPPDYPMVARSFAERRSAIAKQIGFGKSNHSRRIKAKRA